jgi:hypothetical protein
MDPSKMRLVGRVESTNEPVYALEVFPSNTTPAAKPVNVHSLASIINSLIEPTENIEEFMRHAMQRNAHLNECYDQGSSTALYEEMSTLTRDITIAFHAVANLKSIIKLASQHNVK